MKQTHKLPSMLADVAAVVAGSASLTAAARQLKIDRSTLYRWISAGKVARPEARPRRHRCHNKAVPANVPERHTPSTPGPQPSPDAWGHWARETFDLDATEHTLVALAESALALARDEGGKPEIRLSATARFQQLVKQLDFEEAIDGKEEEAITPARTRPRRVS